LEAIEEHCLRGEHFLAGRREVEPPRPVHLGKLLRPAGAWRPLRREGHARDAIDVDVAGCGPRMNQLATRLADRTEGSELAAGRILAELFPELPPCDILRELAVFDLAFRDGPRPGVAALPERSAWMN